MPNVQDGSVCDSGSTTLIATGANAGGTYNWYANKVGGEILYTGSTYETPTLSSDTEFYATIVNANGCESERKEVNVTVDSYPDVPFVEDTERCDAGSVTLNASGSIAGQDINWYYGTTGGAAFASGTSVRVDNVTESTIYYAATVNPGGCESGRVPLYVTITPSSNVDIGGDLELCVNGDFYDLTSDLQADVDLSKGRFVGPGVIENKFYPSVAGTGNHVIDFIFTE